MPTLYVENVPAELYAALRARAKANRASMAAETIAILQREVPTAPELKRREEIVNALEQLRRHAPPVRSRTPTTVALQRQARRELEERTGTVGRTHAQKAKHRP